MISLIYKSKLLREELKHWTAIAALTMWGLTATVVAITRRQSVVLIGMDDAGTRLITAQSDRLIREEIKAFLKYFFEMQYSYNDTNYNNRMSLATDLYSESLWKEQRPKIVQIGENLKRTPLSQNAEIQSIDRTEDGHIESILMLRIKSRMSEQQVKLKVNLEYRKAERDERNPWGFQITSISEALL